MLAVLALLSACAQDSGSPYVHSFNDLNGLWHLDKISCYDSTLSRRTHFTDHRHAFDSVRWDKSLRFYGNGFTLSTGSNACSAFYSGTLTLGNGIASFTGMTLSQTGNPSCIISQINPSGLSPSQISLAVNDPLQVAGFVNEPFKISNYSQSIEFKTSTVRTADPSDVCFEVYTLESALDD